MSSVASAPAIAVTAASLDPITMRAMLSNANHKVHCVVTHAPMANGESSSDLVSCWLAPFAAQCEVVRHNAALGIAPPVDGTKGYAEYEERLDEARYDLMSKGCAYATAVPLAVRGAAATGQALCRSYVVLRHAYVAHADRITNTPTLAFASERDAVAFAVREMVFGTTVFDGSRQLVIDFTDGTELWGSSRAQVPVDYNHAQFYERWIAWQAWIMPQREPMLRAGVELFSVHPCG